MTVVRSFLMMLVTVMVLFYSLTAAATPIDEIIVFGDSLSDNGNLYAFTQKAHEVFSAVPVMPKSPPYFQGRFTNGWNWIDDLGRYYKVKVDDYAYGGSWAEPILDSKMTIPFGLDVQMDDYLMRNMLDMHRDKHLFIIWSGSNDYARGRDNPDYATTNAVESIRRQIATLIYYGAKNIFVVGVPDLSLVPEVRDQGSAAMLAAKSITTQHNQKLITMIKNIQKLNPSINIMLYDLTPDFSDMFDHPDKYNLKITLTACYYGNFYLASAAMSDANTIDAAKSVHLDLVDNASLHAAYSTAIAADLGATVCSNADDYLFFDTIHPTRVVHQLIADKAVTYLQAHGVG